VNSITDRSGVTPFSHSFISLIFYFNSYLRWRGFDFVELAKYYHLIRWRGFAIRAFCSVGIRAIV
jgi:hypothetical protein